jgi:hypothetical protein
MLRRGKVIVGVLVILLILVGYWGWAGSKTNGGEIWVAAVDISPGEIITEKMVRAVATESDYKGLPLGDILGKKAILKIPSGAVISVGLEEPKKYEGSLVNVPVTLKTAGVVTPGDVVELIGISDNAQIIESLGEVKVMAFLDKKGQILYERSEDAIPVVLVVEVPTNRVVRILEFLTIGSIYPILGGVEINDTVDGE